MSRVLRFPAARLGCAVVRSDLGDQWLERGTVPTWMEIHLNTCLACQADLGPGRLVAEDLAALAETPDHRAPAGFLEAVMAGLGDPTPSELRRRHTVVGWSVGAVSTAIVTAVVLLVRRSRVAGAH